MLNNLLNSNYPGASQKAQTVKKKKKRCLQCRRPRFDLYRCESWTIKKAEYQRIDAFELWCWRLFRVPGIARRSKQSILKEINPQYSLEALMLKLKLQYFGYLMQRADSLEKTLMLEKIEGRRKGWQKDEMHHWLNGHEFEQTLGDGEGQGSLACCSPWGCKEWEMTWGLNNYPDLIVCNYLLSGIIICSINASEHLLLSLFSQINLVFP